MRANQFTIRRLLAHTTVVAIGLALVAAFPVGARTVTGWCLLLSPALLVSAFALWHSPKRTRTATVLGIFVLIALILTPQMSVNWGAPPTFWDTFLADFTTVGLSTGIAAFLAASIDALCLT